MAHINPQLPADGQQNWASTADSYLTTLTDQVNTHDDQIQGLLANGGGGGGGAAVVDNGDNTITILPSGGGGGGGGTASIAFDTDGVPYVASV